MIIASLLQLRRERARQIDPAGVEELGQGWYVVPSSRDPTGYAVHVELDPEGRLTTASYICHNVEKRTAGPDAPTHRGLRI